MKGVVFTATDEALATPTPAELTNLFINSPRVGFNFTKIFNFAGDGSDRAENEKVRRHPLRYGTVQNQNQSLWNSETHPAECRQPVYANLLFVSPCNVQDYLNPPLVIGPSSDEGSLL
jgi:hypothetical protein